MVFVLGEIVEVDPGGSKNPRILQVVAVSRVGATFVAR